MAKTKKDIYLVSHVLKVARKGAHTSAKNFGNNEAGWQWNEEVEFKQRLNKRDQTSAAIILGIHNKEIIRSRLNPAATYDELYNYFYENGYKDYLDRIAKAEAIVKEAIEQAMQEMKDNNEPAKWNFPKAEDFVEPTTMPPYSTESGEVTPISMDEVKNSMHVSYGAMPPNPEYIGMTAEELSQRGKEQDRINQAAGYTPIKMNVEDQQAFLDALNDPNHPDSAGLPS